MYKKIATSLFFVLFIVPTFFLRAETTNLVSEKPQRSVTITNAGTVSIKGAQVLQLAGPTFFTRIYWGDVFLRVIIRTDSGAKLTRYSGAPATLGEIAVGDYLNVEGRLTASASTLDVTANEVRNWSLKTDQSRFSGKITALASDGTQATMRTKTNSLITLHFSATTTITKGNLTIPVSRLRVGDSVLSAEGTYTIPTSVLEVENMKIYQDVSIYKPRNFSGIWKGAQNTTLPTSVIVTIGGVDYTVYLSLKSQVWNNLKSPTALSRFLSGDTVRLYGQLRESLNPVIDAEIIRNTKL